MINNLRDNIICSCVGDSGKGQVTFVENHALVFIVSGELYFYTSTGTIIFKAGNYVFVRKNQLVKTVKRKALNRSYLSVTVLLNQDFLRKFQAERKIHSSGIYTDIQLVELPPDPFIAGYFKSLLPYFDQPERFTSDMSQLKLAEAVTLLIRDFNIKNLLFDFNEPFKIDLKEFMNRHFTYNVPITQFATLVGRSLATFKRDFKKDFNMAPERWLRERRLEQAHFLLSQHGLKPTEVYLDVGFESLSHFSTAFKKHYGVSPSKIKTSKS